MPWPTPKSVQWWDLPAQDFRDRYARDFPRMAREVLEFLPWSKQDEVLRSLDRFTVTVVPAGHGVGKTQIAAVAAVCFFLTAPDSVVVTTAPTGYQVKLLLWKYVGQLMNRKVAPRWPRVFEVLQTEIKCVESEEWFAIGLSPAEDVNFTGFHREYLLVILDEAPGVRRAIFEAAQTLMTTEHSRMLLIGNPVQPSGHFYDACTGKIPDANVVRISCLDSPNFTDEAKTLPAWVRARLVTPKWVDDRRVEWGEDSPLWQARVLGEFPGASVSAIISKDWLFDATERPATSARHPRCLGVDVARHGDDKTAYVSLLGNVMRVEGWDVKKDTMHVAGRTASLCEQLGIEVCCIDAAGLGWGPYDRLIERQEQDGFLRDCEFVAVDAGKAARHPELYPNTRSELWFDARDAWHPETGAGLRLERDDTLIEDLSAPEYGYDSKGRRVAETKDEMKRRLGRSPDFGDAANLAVRGAAGRRDYSLAVPGSLLVPTSRGQYEPRVATSWNKAPGEF